MKDNKIVFSAEIVTRSGDRVYYFDYFRAKNYSEAMEIFERDAMDCREWIGIKRCPPNTGGANNFGMLKTKEIESYTIRIRGTVDEGFKA